MILRNPSLRRDFFLILTFLSFVFSNSLFSQGLVGIVREETTRYPVPYASVAIIHADSILVSFMCDSLGRYSFITEKAMRIQLRISAPGYEVLITENIILDGYTTHQAEHLLRQNAFLLEGVTVKAARRQNELYNITKDDLNTIAGNYDDPIRVAVSKPGIVQLNDQANHISVRGQNPFYNTWHLEGLEIVNPNHTNNAGTISDRPTQSGGGISLFSAQALDHTNIYTGINPLSIGRSAGAVTDMYLHESAEPEYRAKAGFLGFELGGGIRTGQSSMLDVNVRYSFTGLLADMGVDFGGEKIHFSDAVISFSQRGIRHRMKIFLWGGSSSNEFDRVARPDVNMHYKDFFDIDFDSYQSGIGLSYDKTFNTKLSFRTGISGSRSVSDYFRQGQFGDLPVSISLRDEVELLSSLAELNFQASPSFIFTGGLSYLYKTVSLSLTQDESFLRPYLNLGLQLASTLQLELGGDLNYAFAAGSDAASIYPGYRAQVEWSFHPQHYLYAGARHSAGQNVETFGPEELFRLPLLIDKYEIGWGFQSFLIKSYFQKLSNLPVYFVNNGFFHRADLMDPVFIPSFNNTNEGVARYYGIELEWDFWLLNDWKFSFNETLYKSARKIKGSGFERGRFDGAYIHHLSVSKEIIRTKKEKNRIWNFSLRGIAQGGLWEQSIDPVQSEELEITAYESPGAFDERLPAYYRMDVSASRTIAHEKVRWRFALDIQNLLNQRNIAYHYYDPFLDRVEAQEHLGIIPVFSVQASW